MNYFGDAQTLLSEARTEFEAVKALYELALNEQDAEMLRLATKIKHLLEDSRSALDYATHGLVDKYGRMPAEHRSVQFPYARENQNRETFVQNLPNRIPGVTTSRPDVIDVLAGFQHFGEVFGRGSTWLPRFMELANENKHRNLTPQTARTMLHVTLTVEIPAGATIEIPWPLTADGPGQLSSVVKKAFMFSSTDIPVLMFLEETLSRVEQIVAELSAF